MLLAIDVGNTNTVFGIYKDEELIGSFRLSTTAGRTSDELGMQIHMYYSFLGLQTADTEAVIVASVVPPVMYTLINAIRKYIGVRPMIVGKDVDTGLVNRYDNPREVGIDRLVNAVSAIQKYGAPLIIIDIGTATTFDVIDETGAYCGGAIFPGIKVAMEALFQKASKLPRVDIVRPEKAIGVLRHDYRCRCQFDADRPAHDLRGEQGKVCGARADWPARRFGRRRTGRADVSA